MKKIVGVLAMLSALLLFWASPAQALPTDCTSGWFCLYENTSSPYGNATASSSAVTRNLCIPFPAGADSISYVYNRTGLRWYLFRTTSCGGSHIEVPPFGAGTINAYAPDGTWDNHIVAMMRTSLTS